MILRDATLSDVAGMLPFILEHGPNPWNHLPEEEIAAHLRAIGAGTVSGVVALDGRAIVGFATFHVTGDFARYQARGRSDAAHGYIREAVVHREYAGQGLGTRLLSLAVERLARLGMREVYIDRHEENAGSAGMMRKAGFAEIDVYDDPERRPSGSRRTAVCRVAMHQTPTDQRGQRGKDQ